MAIDSKLARPGVAAVAAAVLLALAQPSIAQPLASWNDSPARAAIVQFVKDVDARGTPSFVPPDEGILPEQVIGSQGKVAFEMREGRPVLVKLPQVDLVDDKAGKPVAIHKHIGRRPIAAFGNSDGDLEMLQWATAGSGRRFALIVHHTDAEREWAYERTPGFGELDKALREARTKGWIVVDMKRDWKKVYAFE